MPHLESLQKAIDILESAKIDADKFDLGNARAGTRLRTKALEARKALDELRKSVQEEKKARAGD